MYNGPKILYLLLQLASQAMECIRDVESLLAYITYDYLRALEKLSFSLNFCLMNQANHPSVVVRSQIGLQTVDRICIADFYYCPHPTNITRNVLFIHRNAYKNLFS